MRAFVFEGGGMSAVAHLGVIKYLKESELHKNIRCLGGSSAGAIATVLACVIFDGYSIEYLMKKIKEIPIPKIGVLNCLLFFKNKGLFDTDFIKKFISDIIGPITFSEFTKKYGKNIYITASSLEGKLVYFSEEESPDLEVSESVARSCSFPFVFKPRAGFVDGGLMNNFPFGKLNEICKGETGGSYILEPKIKYTGSFLSFIGFIISFLAEDKSRNILGDEKKNIVFIETKTETFDFGDFSGIKIGYEKAKDKFKNN